MKLKLTDRTYDIEFVSNSKMQTTKQKKESNIIYGTHYSTECLIQVNNELKTDMQVNTLMHEILHACDNMSYVKNLTEVQTEAIGRELLCFIKNNPKIIKWLSKG